MQACTSSKNKIEVLVEDDRGWSARTPYYARILWDGADIWNDPNGHKTVEVAYAEAVKQLKRIHLGINRSIKLGIGQIYKDPDPTP